MKILIINGSPKGEYSITYQTCLYLQKKFPEHEFDTVHAGQRIPAIEKDPMSVIEKMKDADLILFSYPVYTFMVPSQLHRLIELLKDRKEDFTGKYMTQITTSKHFYDVTAHRFMEENCRDLGMEIIPGLSADMEDLLNEKGQSQAVEFLKYVISHIKKEVNPEYHKFDVVVVTDLEEGNTELENLIALFKEKMKYPVRVENLRDFPFKGGCLGCMNCAANGKCIYKDGFDTYLRTKIQNADAIVYAFTIKDHSMGSLLKMYDDRQFCNGHRTVTAGSPVGYLVNGKVSEESNLRMVMEARADVGSNFLAGIACDEVNAEASVTAMAEEMTYSLEHMYSRPQMFFGVGGMKIFRDLIYQMRGLMKEDHKFFKSHGQYDFPHKKKGTILSMYLVGALFSNDKLRQKASGKIKEGMVAGYKKILEKE